MPQYEMDKSGSITVTKIITFGSLDGFTQGYIEAIFFTNNAPGVTTEEWQATEDHAEGSIPDDVGFGDIAPGTLQCIIRDCRAFQDRNESALDALYEMTCDGMEYTAERAGHDYWLTRNGHGAGFWSRSWDDPRGETIAKTLSRACRGREVDVYLGDDGKVYLA